MIFKTFCTSICVSLCLFAQESAPPNPPAVPAQPLPPEVTAWEVLNHGLIEKDVFKRQIAVASLGVIGPQPEAIKKLAEAQQDKEDLVRLAAVKALGDLKCPEAIPYLKAALEDTDEIAFVAAKGLWDIKDRSGRVVFQEVLTGERKDAPGMVTSAIRDARKKMHSRSGLMMIGVKEASGALLGPASMGISFAEEAMKDSGAPGRVVATSFLAEDPDPYALTLLEWALGDKNWAVRAASARALGLRGNDGTVRKLMTMLTDPKEGVTYVAAASIIRLQDAIKNGKVFQSQEPAPQKPLTARPESQTQTKASDPVAGKPAQQ